MSHKKLAQKRHKKKLARKGKTYNPAQPTLMLGDLDNTVQSKFDGTLNAPMTADTTTLIL